MSIWNSLLGWLWASGADTPCAVPETLPGPDVDGSVNPATGLPMVGGGAGVDVAGNPFGIDVHARHTGSGWHDSGSSHDNWADNGSWSDGSSGWDGLDKPEPEIPSGGDRDGLVC